MFANTSQKKKRRCLQIGPAFRHVAGWTESRGYDLLLKVLLLAACESKTKNWTKITAEKQKPRAFIL